MIAVALMTGISPAIAQQFPTVPDHSVIGRIGTGSASGPSQAIPWATLISQLSLVTTSRNINTTSPLAGGGSLASDLTLTLGTVPVGKGGTGQVTFTAHCVLLGNVTSALNCLNGSGGNSSLPLISQGASLDPVYAALGLGGLATGSLDTAIGYWGSTTASALAVNNCTGALTYSTSTHTFGCNTTSGTGTVTSVTCGTGLSGGTFTTTGTCAVNQTVVTNSLGSNTAIANGGVTDGPSTAQGTSGGWWASGTVTIGDTVANVGSCKLWDGTNAAVASTNFRQTSTASVGVAISLSGFISSPAGNIRISCTSNDATATFRFNDSGSGKDSTLTVHRIQ